MKLLTLTNSAPSSTLSPLASARRALSEGQALTEAEASAVLDALDTERGTGQGQGQGPFLGSAPLLTADDLKELGLSDDDAADIDTGGSRQPDVQIATEPVETIAGEGDPLDPPTGEIADLNQELDDSTDDDEDEDDDEDGLNESLVLKPFRVNRETRKPPAKPAPSLRRRPEPLSEGLVTIPLASRHRGKGPSLPSSDADLERLAAGLTGIPL